MGDDETNDGELAVAAAAAVASVTVLRAVVVVDCDDGDGPADDETGAVLAVGVEIGAPFCRMIVTSES